MAWETMVGDIILQDGTFAFLFTAGEALYRGQAVYVSADNTVSICTATTDNSVGVVIDNAANGAQCAVAGPGNVVLCAAASDIAPGTAVYGTQYGLFTSTAGSATKVGGVVTSSPGTTITSANDYTEVLLL